MILECACGKMYRVRDDAANPPTKCPVCGGLLRAAGGSSPNVLGTDSKLKEAERDRDEARTKVASLERQLEEARSASAENSRISLTSGDLRAATEKADRLERELLALRSEAERNTKDLERERLQARETADRESAERRKVESRLSALEETHTRALEGKQKTIDALDASVATYRAKVDQLQKQLEKAELQRLADIQTFENRMREREEKDRTELDQVGQNHLRALTELRGDMEGKIADKDRQISDQRQVIDREAGERRRLNEVLTRLQESATREMKEKDAALKTLEATLGSFKAKAETLQRRVNDLEQLRRSDLDAQAARLRSAQALRARIEEAGHFASDLDHAMDGVDSLLSGLRERMRRLKETLSAPPEPEPIAPTLAMPAYSPISQPEPEPAVAPALSQAGFEYSPTTAAAPAEDVLEEVPSSEPESAVAEMEPVNEFRAKVHPPSEVNIPAIREPEPEPMPLVEEPAAEVEEAEPAVEEEPPAPAPSRKALEEETNSIPLISHPDDDDEPLPPKPPPPPKKEAPRAKFSWKRK